MEEKSISQKQQQQQQNNRIEDMNAVYNAHISFTFTHVSSHIPKPSFFKSSVLSAILFYLVLCLTIYRSFSLCFPSSYSFFCLFVYILWRKTRTNEEKSHEMNETTMQRDWKNEECFHFFKSKVHIALKRCFWNWWIWMNT